MRAVPRDTPVALSPAAAAASPLRARLPRRLLTALVALALAGAVVAGVIAAAGEDTAQRAVAPAGPVRIAGKPLQSANCAAWWRAGPGERAAAVAALTRSIGGPTVGGRGATLPAARVHRLFDRVCAPTFTSHFLLYEIYTRAAGLSSLGG